MLVTKTSAPLHDAIGEVASRRRREVDDHAPLAAVVEVEGWVAVDEAPGREPEQRAHRVARGRLDLDDVRSPVGHDAGRGRHRDPESHLDDAEPLQYAHDGGEHAAARRARSTRYNQT
jgi:hypothetical protein